MNQFARMQGASLPETAWFSRACNAAGGQIDQIRRTLKRLQFASSKPLNGPKAHPAHFSLHIFAVLAPFRSCL